jgi:DNA polymerase III delta prime subunit
MNHHAYYVAGDSEEGIGRALAYGERTLGLPASGNPDVVVLRYSLFSVDEARKVHDVVHRMPMKGDTKLIVISASRMFHEAQNALLKVFEEPPSGTYIVLVIPSEGVLIPTLRSRLLSLEGEKNTNVDSEFVQAFLVAVGEEREKMVAKLLDRAKSDKAEEKQSARNDALALANGLAKAAYAKKDEPEMQALLSDLNRFIPILHERSAPLKLILEHLLVVIPARIH